MTIGIADRFDVGISLAAGVIVTLYGFGLIGRRPGVVSDPRTARFLAWAKWLGPVLVIISAVRFLAAR